MLDYSLLQDLKNKKALFYKLQNLETYQNTVDLDTAAGGEYLSSQCILNKKKLLVSHNQNILFLCKVINFCLPALDVVCFFYKIYDQIHLEKKITRENFTSLYNKIIFLMGSKEGVTQLSGEDKILFFLQGIGLSEAHYKLDIEKWLDKFFKYENFGDKTLGISLYMVNSIYNKFSYLYKSKFVVDSEKIRDEIKIIFSCDMSSFLVENYQWFGLYIFVVYKVLNRFLRTLTDFKDCGEFISSIQLKNYNTLINTDVIGELNEFPEKIVLLLKSSTNVMLDIPHKISYAEGLQYLQELHDDADNFLVSLYSFIYKAFWIKKWQFCFGISEINILSLLDLFREKFSNKIEISLKNIIIPKSRAWYKKQIDFYCKFIKENIDSSFVYSSFVYSGDIEKKRDLRIFLEYFSSVELPLLIKEYLFLLIYYVYTIANVQHSAFELKNTFLVNLRTSVEEKFLAFINKKQKELTAISNKKKLYDEYFLLFYQIADTSPFFCFLSVDQIKQIDSFQEKCKKNCALFEKQRNKVKPTKKNKKSAQKMPKSQISEFEQKPISLDKILPELIAQLTKLRINIFKSLNYIEELADAYKSINKLKILINRFKSASGQIYAAKFFLKKFLQIESDVSIAVLFEKLIQYIEIHDKKNQNVLKKEIAPCLELVERISVKIKKLEEKRIALKQKKEILILGGVDKRFFLSTLKEIAQDLKTYEFIKEQLAFLYNLMRMLSLEELSNQDFPVEYATKLEDFTQEFKNLKNNFEIMHSIIICTINNGLLRPFYPSFEELLQQNLQTVQAKKAECSEKAPLLDKEKLYSDICSQINNLLKFMYDCYQADSAKQAYSSKVEVNSGYSSLFFSNPSSNNGIKKEPLELKCLNLELSKRKLTEQIKEIEKDFFAISRDFIKSLCLIQSDANASDPEAPKSKLADVIELYYKLLELEQAYVLITKEQTTIIEEATKLNEQPVINFINRNTLFQPDVRLSY